MLPILYRRVAGLDVHKKSVVATRMQVTEEDRAVRETETFGTTTPDHCGCTIGCWSGIRITWRWRVQATTGDRCTTCWKTRSNSWW